MQGVPQEAGITHHACAPHHIGKFNEVYFTINLVIIEQVDVALGLFLGHNFHIIVIHML